jgi:hypothetical protein
MTQKNILVQISLRQNQELTQQLGPSAYAQPRAQQTGKFFETNSLRVT